MKIQSNLSIPYTNGDPAISPKIELNRSVPLDSVHFEGWFKKKESETPIQDTVLRSLKYLGIAEFITNFFYKNRSRQADFLTNKLWDKYFEPMVLKNPEETRANLGKWIERVENLSDKGLIQETTVRILRAIMKGLDKPEVLKNMVRTGVILFLNGGAKRLKTIFELVKTDAYLNADEATRGKMMAQALGPICVKTVQTVSTVPGLFSEEAKKSMEPLYENASSLPLEKIQERIEGEFQRSLNEIFLQFDENALKAGSIAQIHSAFLHESDTQKAGLRNSDYLRVAVKVVKEDAEQALKEDLGMLKPLAELIHQLYPTFDSDKFFTEFERLLTNECNMAAEAKRLVELKALFSEVPNLRVPKVIESHTTSRVLTMEYLEGKSLLAFKGNTKVAKDYLGLILDQVFTYGACQADPHPGNMPYNEALDQFNFLDAGLVYSIKPKERTDFAKLLMALVSQDAGALSEALIASDMYDIRPHAVASYRDYLTSILPKKEDFKYEKVIQFLTKANLKAKEMELEVNQVNPLLWKTLFTAFSVAKQIDPDFQPHTLVGKKLLAHLWKNDKQFLIKTGLASVLNWIDF
jgi:ubiquinone biosynthesis protein